LLNDVGRKKWQKPLFMEKELVHKTPTPVTRQLLAEN
jgi:hypothetical protein